MANPICRGQVKVNDRTIDFTVTHSVRKTVGIKVKPSGEVVICLPNTCKTDYAWSVARKNFDWIEKKRRELKEAKPETENRLDGGHALYKGVTYPAEITMANGEEGVFAEEHCIHIMTSNNSPDHIRWLLVEFYSEQCKQYLMERLPYFSGLLSVTYGIITIKEVKSIWGSCSYKNNITFNWRLILAPPNIFDYVMVHELCHIQHKNHSQDFWNAVAAIMPDWHDSRKWLKANSAVLSQPI